MSDQNAIDVANEQHLPAEFHPDFPQGDDAKLLFDTRETIITGLTALGYEFSGCGMGVGRGKGEADIGLRKDGKRIEVRIFLPEDK